ncbi:unnamed protein product, partial [Symbiodinium sp. CCMP2456]
MPEPLRSALPLLIELSVAPSPEPLDLPTVRKAPPEPSLASIVAEVQAEVLAEAFGDGSQLPILLAVPGFPLSVLHVSVPTHVTADGLNTIVQEEVLNRLESCWDACAPVWPRPDADSAAFIAYPSCFSVLGRRAVLIDTRDLGGSVFASVVPSFATLQDLRRVSGWDSVRAHDVFTPGSNTPLCADQSVGFRHGDLIKFMRPLSSPAWTTTRLPTSNGHKDSVRLPYSPAAVGALVLHPDRTAYLSSFGHDDWATMQQAAALIDVPLSSVRMVAACLPAGSSLVHRGNHVKGVIGVVPRNCGGEDKPSASLTAVFLDCRPLGQSMSLIAFEGFIISRDALRAAAGVPLLTGWTIAVNGGRRCKEGFEVYHGETLILAYTRAASVPCPEVLLSESEESDQGTLPESSECPAPRLAPLSYASLPGIGFKTPSEGTENLALNVQASQEQGIVGHLPAPFHRIGEFPPLAEGPLPALGDHDSDDEDDSVWHPTFMIYAMHTVPEEVQVTLRAPCQIETAREAVSAAMSDQRSRYYPNIVFADPQPTQYWGAAIALPGWAKRDPIVLLNMLDLDDRCFLASLANPFSRAQVIRAAGLPPDSAVDVFAFREHIPMGPDRECDLVTGGTVTIQRSGARWTVQGHSIWTMLVSPHCWDPAPQIQAPPRGHRVLVVQDDAFGCFSTDVADAQLLNAVLQEHGVMAGQAYFAISTPPPGDLQYLGFHCERLCAFALAGDEVARPPSTHCVTILDCRPLLQGWALWLTDEPHVSHVELVDWLDTFSPDGWQPQVEGAEIDNSTGKLAVHNGCVLIAEYVPSTSAEFCSSPADHGASCMPEADEDSEPDESSDTSEASSPRPRHHAPDRSRSPRRGPPPPSPRARGCLACCCAVAVLCTPVGASVLDFASPAHRVLLAEQARYIGIAYAFIVLSFSILGCPHVGHRFLSEPAGHSPTERWHLSYLRRLTRLLGGRWHYDEALEPYDGVHLMEAPHDALSDDDGEIFARIGCAVLKVGYRPELLSVAICMPATEDELAVAVQAARGHDCRRRFPNMHPILPQPVCGTAVFIATPAWSTDLHAVCFSTACIDGRVFVIHAPDYVSRHELLWLARINNPEDVDIYVGTAEDPLIDEVPVHLFPAALVSFVPRASSPNRRTLGERLLSTEGWTDVPTLPIIRDADAYCVVQLGASFLHFSPPEPTRYRDAIAQATGIALRVLRIQAAQPRPTDVEIDGYQCRTVLAAAEPPHVYGNRPWHCCLLDCRQIQDAWRILRVHAGRIHLPHLLETIDDDAPRGWQARIDVRPDAHGWLHTHPGQILVVEYVPLAADDGHTQPPGGASGPPPPANSAASTLASGASLATQPEGSPSTLPVEPVQGEGMSEAQDVHIPFLLFAQECWPEHVLVRVIVPAMPSEAFGFAAQAREAEDHRKRPRIVEVYPQPRAGQVCALALPLWRYDGAAVLIDSRFPYGHIFAQVLPKVIRRADMLNLLGLSMSSDVRVFVRDMPWPLQAGDPVDLAEGDLITVLPAAGPFEPLPSLASMLRRPRMWEPFPELGGAQQNVSWVLSDGPVAATSVDRDLFASSSSGAAASLRLPDGSFTLVPTSPAIDDHARLGVLSRGVLVACQTHDFTPNGRNAKTPFVLDLRPILLTIGWAYAPDSLVDVASLCHRLAWRCPAGYHIRIYGGSLIQGGNHYRRVEPGEVLTVEFQPNYLQGIRTHDSPATVPPASSANSDFDPDFGGDQASSSTSSRADAGTGATQRYSAGYGSSGRGGMQGNGQTSNRFITGTPIHGRRTLKPDAPACQATFSGFQVTAPDLPSECRSDAQPMYMCSLGVNDDDASHDGEPEHTPVSRYEHPVRSADASHRRLSRGDRRPDRTPCGRGERPAAACLAVGACICIAAVSSTNAFGVVVLLALSRCSSPIGIALCALSQPRVFPVAEAVHLHTVVTAVPRGTVCATSAADHTYVAAGSGPQAGSGRTTSGVSRPIPTPCRGYGRIPRSLPQPTHASSDTARIGSHSEREEILSTLLERSMLDNDYQPMLAASIALEEAFARPNHTAYHTQVTRPTICLNESIPFGQDMLPSGTEPEVFDLEARQCLLPGTPAQTDWLLQRAPLSLLSGPPHGLNKPDRFAAWVAEGCVGRAPAPGELVVLTSDGSFQDSHGRVGWGLVVSLVESSTLLLPGQFVGCFYGDVTSLVGGESDGSRHRDAYSAEVAGLCWSAIASLQLAISCPVIFRSDCTSALAGAEGTVSMRSDNLCQAARCLHATASQASPAAVRYQHVPGHAGDFANELADALANHGADGHSLIDPLRFDVAMTADLSFLQWLPHFCLSRRRGLEVPCLQHQVLRWNRGPGAHNHSSEHVMKPFLRAFPQSGGDADGHSPQLCQWRMVSFNVLSLQDSGGQSEAGAGIHGAVGRPSLLQQSLETMGVAIAGLQECRTSPGSMRCGRYTRFSSGADPSSCFGIELWIHDDSPCKAASVAVLHASPTILIVSAALMSRPIRIIVAHAPHRAHTSSTKQSWWKRFSHLCHTYVAGGLAILMMDANCRLGSETSSAIGSFQPDAQDESGLWFHRLLEEQGLWLPATFEHCMSGDGGTLRQKRSGSLDRSDFIGVPGSWFNSTCRAWVEPHISAGHMCIDHMAAALDVSLLMPSASHTTPRAKRIDVRALADPQNAEAVAHIINTSPRPAWTVDVSEHAAVVVDHLYQGLVDAFPVRRGRMRTGYLTDGTSALHRVVSSLRHSVRCKKMALRYALLRCAWQAWQSAENPLLALFQGQWLWQLETRYALSCMLLRRYGILLRRACREDRNQMYAEIANEIATSAPSSMHGVVQKVLKPKKYRKGGNAPLPTLYRADGSQCLTQNEITTAWREHFRVLEGGLETTPPQLLAACRASQEDFEGSDTVDASHMPTWMDLEAALRRTAARKAAGPDLLPPMLCKRFSPQLTSLLWPLLLKTVCGAAEAAGMKGGTLHHICKPHPKSPHTCDAHRGILVQSALSKAFHRSLRGLVVKHWTGAALPLQIGGRSGCSASFGHLCSRALLHYAYRNGLSASLIFIDLSSAYYAVIRETLFGKDLSSRPVHEIAAALGLDCDDLQELTRLVEHEAILPQQDAPALMQELAHEFHQQTWFVLHGDEQMISTFRGTRPGGTLADIMFNLLFGQALKRRKSSSLLSAVPSVPWSGQRTLFPTSVAENSPLKDIPDIVYADDLCIPVVCEKASKLRGVVSAVAADTFDTLTPHALRVNLGPTKTAAIMAHIGPGSRAARHESFGTLKGRAPVFPDNKGLLWLDLVARYRHLGAVVAYDGSMRADVKHRLALARSAFKDGMFHCKGGLPSSEVTSYLLLQQELAAGLSSENATASFSREGLLVYTASFWASGPMDTGILPHPNFSHRPGCRRQKPYSMSSAFDFWGSLSDMAQTSSGLFSAGTLITRIGQAGHYFCVITLAAGRAFSRERKPGKGFIMTCRQALILLSARYGIIRLLPRPPISLTFSMAVWCADWPLPLDSSGVPTLKKSTVTVIQQPDLQLDGSAVLVARNTPRSAVSDVICSPLR